MCGRRYYAAKLGITLHGLCHAFTTTARWLGYGDQVLARLIGHVLNDSQTSRYGDVPDEQVRDAAERVSRRIATLLKPCAQYATRAAPLNHRA